MRLRMLVLAMLVAGLFVVPASAQAAKPPPSATITDPIAITAPVASTVFGTGTFTGTFDLQPFASQGGQLVAVGTLQGQVTDASGAVVQTINQQVRIPITGGPPAVAAPSSTSRLGR
jgi:hypothetical protein